MHLHEVQIHSLSTTIQKLKSEGFTYISCSSWSEGDTPITFNAHFELLLKMTFGGKVTNVIIGINGQIYYFS